MNRREGEQEAVQDNCNNYVFNNCVFEVSKIGMFTLKKHKEVNKNNIFIRKEVKEKENS